MEACQQGYPRAKMPPAHQRFKGSLRNLARAATALLARKPGLPDLAETTAALQDLTVTLAGESAVDSRLDELRELQAPPEATVQVAANGPYLVTNARQLRD
jgi:hypothetical protein